MSNATSTKTAKVETGKDVKTSKAKANAKKPNKIAKWFRGYRSEFKKIVWMTPKQVLKNTGVTLVMILSIGVFIWILDFCFTHLNGLVK